MRSLAILPKSYWARTSPTVNVSIWDQGLSSGDLKFSTMHNMLNIVQIKIPEVDGFIGDVEVSFSEMADLDFVYKTVDRKFVEEMFIKYGNGTHYIDIKYRCLLDRRSFIDEFPTSGLETCFVSEAMDGEKSFYAVTNPQKSRYNTDEMLCMLETIVYSTRFVKPCGREKQTSFAKRFLFDLMEIRLGRRTKRTITNLSIMDTVSVYGGRAGYESELSGLSTGRFNDLASRDIKKLNGK